MDLNLCLCQKDKKNQKAILLSIFSSSISLLALSTSLNCPLSIIQHDDKDNFDERQLNEELIIIKDGLDPEEFDIE